MTPHARITTLADGTVAIDLPSAHRLNPTPGPRRRRFWCQPGGSIVYELRTDDPTKMTAVSTTLRQTNVPFFLHSPSRAALETTVRRAWHYAMRLARP